MQPYQFPGSKEIKKPNNMTDEECFSIWALPFIDENLNAQCFLTAWKPSYEDIQAINKGGPIYIKVVSQGLPPMAVFTLDENGNCQDVGRDTSIDI